MKNLKQLIEEINKENKRLIKDILERARKNHNVPIAVYEFEIREKVLRNYQTKLLQWIVDKNENIRDSMKGTILEGAKEVIIMEETIDQILKPIKSYLKELEK
jgi:hypothetical protein